MMAGKEGRNMSEKKNNKPLNLTWEDFQSLGKEEETLEEHSGTQSNDFWPEDIHKMAVRIHLEKKGRRGKEVSIIRGLDLPESLLNQIAKEIKTNCGTGGSLKDGEIIIQGNFRDNIQKILSNKGCRNIKFSGS